MITIQGLRIENLRLEKEDNGSYKPRGAYSLIGNNDIVLAKQSFNGYDEVEVTMCAETKELLNKFTSAFKSDIEKTLGMEG